MPLAVDRLKASFHCLDRVFTTFIAAIVKAHDATTTRVETGRDDPMGAPPNASKISKAPLSAPWTALNCATVAPRSPPVVLMF
jgi:hypothetical protein